MAVAYSGAGRLITRYDEVFRVEDIGDAWITAHGRGKYPLSIQKYLVQAEIGLSDIPDTGIPILKFFIPAVHILQGTFHSRQFLLVEDELVNEVDYCLGPAGYCQQAQRQCYHYFEHTLVLRVNK